MAAELDKLAKYFDSKKLSDLAGGILTFTQTGLAGIISQRDDLRKPQLPWKL